jgi:hypothetical protein
MSVSDSTRGRLGNSIFRYLASSIFAIVYNLEREFGESNNNIIDDKQFIEWKNEILFNNNIKNINLNCKYFFDGYYQHDDILKKFKSQLIEYIHKNPEHLLRTDRGDIYKSIDILKTDKPFNKYDIVLHLRLEDFIIYDMVMNPLCLINILDNYKNEKICIVVNKITTETEQKYIDFFSKKYDIVIESNNVITDYHIMKNARILICSMSTLSWCASFFSETVETLYFPNHNNAERIHETFKKPIENTILYDFNKIDKNSLNNIFKMD